VLEGDVDRDVAREGLVTGQQFVQEDSGRVDVGGGRRLSVGDEFRCEVGDGAEDGAGGRRGRLADGTGQAEIGDLDGAVARHHHVLGLDVTVYETPTMGDGEGIEDGLGGGERPSEGERPVAPEDGPQVLAVDEFHREVERVLPESLVVHGHHVRVGQAGGGPRLPTEPGDEVLRLCQVGMHHLHGHLAVEAPVQGTVHRGHATAGHACEHLVPAVDEPAEQGVGDESAHRVILRSRRPGAGPTSRVSCGHPLNWAISDFTPAT